MSPDLSPPTIIATTERLSDLLARLRSEPLVAVDTESNGLFAYREQVCLIQLSTRSGDWVVDPLELEDLGPLDELFADPRIEKVFHAAEYDLICLKRDYDFRFANIFDTMIAARTVGLKALGLGNLLEEHFGIQVDKRFQRADWSVRPLPPDQLRYAQLDTHYLPALRDILVGLMQDKGCLEEAREVFELLAEAPPPIRTFDPQGYWRINAARDFTRRQMAILRELYLLRDRLAQQRNRPPFKILTDEAMCRIVTAIPQTHGELARISGVGRGLVGNQGHIILQAVQRGLTGRPPAPPERGPRADAETLARFNALHDWRKARATERGVESDVIIPKEALWALARLRPLNLADLDQIPGLGPWKRQRYGVELLNLLAGIGVPNGGNGEANAGEQNGPAN